MSWLVINFLCEPVQWCVNKNHNNDKDPFSNRKFKIFLFD